MAGRIGRRAGAGGRRLVLDEQMAADDEMRVTYNALQSGWQHHPGRAGWLGRPPHTELFFEYTALLVLRSADRIGT